jgi:phage tail-like protein
VAQSSVNAQRSDPYKSFKFRLKWDGRYVAGFSKVSAFTETSEVGPLRADDDTSSSRKSSGRSEFDPITLERGVTHDTEFEEWANKVSALSAAASLKDFRNDVIVEMYDEAGQLIISLKVFRCWVSEFQGTPDLDPNANAVEIQHIKLENEGWKRDVSAASSL